MKNKKPLKPIFLGKKTYFLGNITYFSWKYPRIAKIPPKKPYNQFFPQRHKISRPPSPKDSLEPQRP